MRGRDSAVCVGGGGGGGVVWSEQTAHIVGATRTSYIIDVFIRLPAARRLMRSAAASATDWSNVEFSKRFHQVRHCEVMSLLAMMITGFGFQFSHPTKLGHHHVRKTVWPLVFKTVPSCNNARWVCEAGYRLSGLRARVVKVGELRREVAVAE